VRDSDIPLHPSPWSTPGASIKGMVQIATGDTETLDGYFQDLAVFEASLLQGSLAEILLSSSVQRLKSISFIPELCLTQTDPPNFNRYEHSIGVAYLASSCADTLGLNVCERDSLALAGIIHDLGHTPLSHATEQFLLETKRRYHHAQGLMMAAALKEQVNNRLHSAIDSAIGLLQGKTSRDLSPLLQGIFSADNLDGILRSCLVFELPVFDPRRIVGSLRMINHRIAFADDDSADPAYRERVIHATRQVYHGELRSNYVLASEAMLVRALQTASEEDPSIVGNMKKWGDTALIDALNSHAQSAQLISLLSTKTPFVPLAAVSPQLAHRMLSRAKRTRRTDLRARGEVEKRVANELGIDKRNVILYYTARKTIRSGPTQLSLAISDSTGELVADGGAAPTLIDALHSKQVSPGDAIHIFVNPFHLHSKPGL
jgi:HD superfamily phosphohydrolase